MAFMARVPRLKRVVVRLASSYAPWVVWWVVGGVNGDAGLMEVGDGELVVEREEGGSNQDPEMRERDWGREERMGLMEVCHFLKLDFLRRMGMVRWEM